MIDPIELEQRLRMCLPTGVILQRVEQKMSEYTVPKGGGRETETEAIEAAIRCLWRKELHLAEDVRSRAKVLPLACAIMHCAQVRELDREATLQALPLLKACLLEESRGTCRTKDDDLDMIIEQASRLLAGGELAEGSLTITLRFVTGWPSVPAGESAVGAAIAEFFRKAEMVVRFTQHEDERIADVEEHVLSVAGRMLQLMNAGMRSS